MITVTGANGHLGRGVINRLLELLPAEQVVVSVRDPAKAEDLARRGVRVYPGDFAEPSSLVQAFTGAERVLIVSTDVIGPARAGLHKAAVDAAKQAGARHVVYTSIIDPDPASPFAATADHAATEEYIRASGLHYTLLRNNFYAEGIPLFAGAALAGGSLDVPADGPAAYVARSDLAEATANLLARGGYVDEALDLTGPEALDMAQIANIIGQIQKRTVKRNIMPDATYREGLLAHGLPPEAADGLLSIFAALRQNRFAGVDGTLETLLGRKPRTVAALLKQTATVATQ